MFSESMLLSIIDKNKIKQTIKNKHLVTICFLTTVYPPNKIRFTTIPNKIRQGHFKSNVQFFLKGFIREF